MYVKANNPILRLKKFMRYDQSTSYIWMKMS